MQQQNSDTNIFGGVLLMILAVFLFVSMDAISKHLSLTYDVSQIVWSRYAFHIGLMALYFNKRFPAIMATKKLKHQLLRSAFMLVSSVLIIVGLSQLKLVNVTSILLTGPLFVTALSAPILKEKVGFHRWVAVVIGFIGALIVIRPSVDIFNSASIILLVAALFYALYQISTRSLRTTESPLTTLGYSSVVGLVITSVWAPFEWVAPDLIGWGLMGIVGAMGAISHLCLIKALTIAPASVITPFGYTNILWSTLFGYFLFSELPDQWTVIGAGIIISSGLYILYRENKLNKQLKAKK